MYIICRKRKGKDEENVVPPLQKAISRRVYSGQESNPVRCLEMSYSRPLYIMHCKHSPFSISIVLSFVLHLFLPLPRDSMFRIKSISFYFAIVLVVKTYTLCTLRIRASAIAIYVVQFITIKTQI